MKTWQLWTVVLAAAGAAGSALGAALFPGPDPAIAATVRRAAAALDRDDVESVWDMLAPSTRERFEGSRKIQAVSAAVWKERRDAGKAGPVDAGVVATMEQRAGVSLDVLATASAKEIWTSWVRTSIRASSCRFADRAIEEVRADAQHATVSTSGPDGREQVYQLVHEAGAWRLVDFQPFAAMPVARRRPSTEDRFAPGVVAPAVAPLPDGGADAAPR